MKKSVTSFFVKNGFQLASIFALIFGFSAQAQFSVTWPTATPSFSGASSSTLTASTAFFATGTGGFFTGVNSYSNGVLSGTGITGGVSAAQCGSLYNSVTGSTNTISPYLEFKIEPNAGYSMNTNQFTFTVSSNNAASRSTLAAGYSVDGGVTFTGLGAPTGGITSSTLAISPLWSSFSYDTALTAAATLTFTVPAAVITSTNSLILRLVIWRNNATSNSSGSAFTISSPIITGTTAVSLSPTLSNPVPAALSGFNYVPGAGPSAVQSFTVGGINLTSPLVVTAPSNYEVSINATAGFSNSLSITPSSGNVSNTIFTRLKAGLITGTYNQTISISSGSLPLKTVNCSGFVFANPVNYFIDSVGGSNTNSGTTINTPWQDLSQLYNLTVSPSSTINLKSGSVWTGQQLKFLGSGVTAGPIIVDKYGSGAKPILNGNGLTGQGVVYLYNQEHIEINNLEITNYPPLVLPNTNPNQIFFIGISERGDPNAVPPIPDKTGNPLGADRRGVMVAIDNFGTANHIYLKNLEIHHIKGQLGNGSTVWNGAIPKRTGGIFFTVLGNTELPSSKSRFNDVLIDGCNINYCENQGLALDNEWNVFYPGGQNSIIPADVTEYNNWYDRRYSNVKISNNIIHHIGKNAMIIRCTDETGLIERNVCYETAVGTTGNTMFTARAKGTVFQYNEGSFNRATTQQVDPGNIDGCMYDPDFGSVGIIFQYSYSHDNSDGIYWGCNTRGGNNNTTGKADPGDVGCTLRYCISQNDNGTLVFFNYPSAGNEIYNNVFFVKPGLNTKVIHESSTKDHTYNFFNNIIYNQSSLTHYTFALTGAGIQTRTLANNVFFGTNAINQPTGSSTIVATNSTTADPLFVNPGQATLGISTLNGYKLQTNSPVIATGRLIAANGGLDYYGNFVSATAFPNRGAYEGIGVALSIQDNKNEKANIYPNPIRNNQFTIVVPNQMNGKLTVEIHNLLGQLVHKQEYKVESTEIAVQPIFEMNKGVYLVSLKNDGIVITQKISVQ
jgi:hypothetical protein